MKLIDALLNVDKSSPQSAEYDLFIDASDIGVYNMSSDFHKQWDESMKAYYLVKWYCTDSWVGLLAYYFNDELVGCSWQEGRKCGTKLDFVSIEAARKVREFILSFIDQPEFSILDVEEEIEDHYLVDYGNQLLVSEGFYQGQKVEIVNKWRGDYAAPVDEWSKIVVEFENGETQKIDLSEFKIPLHLEIKNEC